MFCSDLTELNPPAEDWELLRQRIDSDYCFTTTNWYAPWAEMFLPSGGWKPPLRYLVARDASGAAAGILPLAMQVKAGVPFLALGGYYQPYRSFAVARDCAEEVLQSFALALEKHSHGAGLRIGPVPKDDPVSRKFLEALSRRGWRAFEISTGSHFIVRLPDNFTDFEKDVRSRSKRLLKYENRIRGAGRGDIRVFTSGAGDWSKVLADLGEIERQSWQCRQNGDMRFLGQQNVGFWLGVLNSPEAASFVKAWILYLNDAPVSFCFTLDSGRYRYAIGNNYAESVKKYGTGSVLYKYMFQDAIESKVHKVDLGLGDTGYKRVWGGAPEREMVDWVVFRPGVRGWVLHNLLHLKQTVQCLRSSRMLGFLRSGQGANGKNMYFAHDTEPAE